jgi:TPR repeat protein
LHVDSGFSGECVRTGRLLSCHDTETDARVDREGCRALGIRSILAAPVRVGEKVIGILEVFSPHPSAFGPNDSTVMQRLAETVLAAVNRAARSANLTPPAPKPVPFAASPGSVLFASEAGKERDNDLPLEDETHGGIRLPRAHLLVLVCAAATIALVLGYQLAPWIQEKIHAHRSPQTVLASSLPSVNIPAAPAPPTVETATLDQLVQLAETGDAAAQNALGLRYAQGDGVKQNEREAIRWFTKAAEQGNVPAQYKLGLLYWRGDGIPRDTNQAYFWIVLARAGGEVGSKDVAAVLAAGMTHAQAAAIEREAELWFQRHQPMAKSAPDR